MTAKILHLPKPKTYQKVLRKDGSEEPYLLVHRKTGVFYVRKYKAGRGELFKSTGQVQIAKARTMRDQMIADFEGGKVMVSRRRVEHVCAELLRELEREAKTLGDNGQPLRSKRTHDKDITMLRDESAEVELGTIRKYFGEVFVDEIDEEFWKDWRLTEGARLGRTLFDIGKYLNKLLTYAHARRFIARRPTIEIPALATGKQQLYKDADIRNFLEHAEPMLKDLILAEAPTGARPHEITELRWDWIRFEKKRVVICLPDWFVKTRRAREFEANELLAQVLRRRYKTRGSSPYVFPAPKNPDKPCSDKHRSRMWRSMLDRAGIAPGKLKFHWLRHTFYNKALFEAKEPVQKVSEYGGTSIVTLQKNYIKADAFQTASVARSVNIRLEEEEE